MREDSCRDATARLGEFTGRPTPLGAHIGTRSGGLSDPTVPSSHRHHPDYIDLISETSRVIVAFASPKSIEVWGR